MGPGRLLLTTRDRASCGPAGWFSELVGNGVASWTLVRRMVLTASRSACSFPRQSGSRGGAGTTASDRGRGGLTRRRRRFSPSERQGLMARYADLPPRGPGSEDRSQVGLTRLRACLARSLAADPSNGPRRKDLHGDVSRETSGRACPGPRHRRRSWVAAAVGSAHGGAMFHVELTSAASRVVAARLTLSRRTGDPPQRSRCST